MTQPVRVHHRRVCPDCGREFILEYDRITGRGMQSWQQGCDTFDECFKKYMPPSDFRSDQSLAKSTEQ